MFSDTPEGVKANVRAIRQILDQAGRRNYVVKIYPSAAHNLMEVPRDNPNEYVRLKRFPPGFFETMVDVIPALKCWATINRPASESVGKKS